MTSVNGGRKDIRVFQKERSEKNDDLVPRLFPFLFQKEKRKRLSVILSAEKRGRCAAGVFFFFSLFCFLLKKRRRHSPTQWRKEGESFLFFFFHKDSLWGGFLFSLSSFSFCANDVMHSSVSSSCFPFFFSNKKPSARRGRKKKRNNAKKNPAWCKRRDMEGYHIANGK